MDVVECDLHRTTVHMPASDARASASPSSLTSCRRRSPRHRRPAAALPDTLQFRHHALVRRAHLDELRGVAPGQLRDRRPRRRAHPMFPCNHQTPGANRRGEMRRQRVGVHALSSCPLRVAPMQATIGTYPRDSRSVSNCGAPLRTGAPTRPKSTDAPATLTIGAARLTVATVASAPVSPTGFPPPPVAPPRRAAC